MTRLGFGCYGSGGRYERRSVYHLAERYRDARGYERLSEHRGPFTRDEAERELRDAMSDPPGDRDESLCVGRGDNPMTRHATPQILHRFNPVAQAALEEGTGRLEGEYVVLRGAGQDDIDRLAEERFEALTDDGGAW